jgi:hypothetical protein
MAALIAGSFILGSCGTESGNAVSAVDDAAVPTDQTAGETDQLESDRAQPDALAMAAEVGNIDLSEDDARLVAVEAAWLCRAQRFSFGDPSEMTAARNELLAANGVTAEQYAAFTSELADRLELRKAVLAEFAAECLQKD